MISQEKKFKIVGNASGFDMPIDDLNNKLIYPFSPYIYENRRNIWRKKNTWLNLGNWLLGALIMKSPSPPSFLDRGLTFFAIGVGDPAWDVTPVAPDPEDDSLHDEYYRMELHPSNFRAVNKTEQTYTSHDGLSKIEIDPAILPVQYGDYVGTTLQITTDDPSVTEERFIIGYETNGTNYWLLDSDLLGTPLGANYHIFVPIQISDDQKPTLKTLDHVYIEIEIIISSDDANGDMREFGFFGGWATEELDSGMIWNAVRHDLIQKEPLHWIARRIRFDFC